MNAVYESIKGAQIAASNFPVPITVDATAPLLTLDQMIIGNIHVDGWLKVNPYGLFIDSDRTPFQALELGLPMNEIGYNYSIKVGNPVTYLKTYDRITCATGGSWAEAQARAQSIDLRAREYRSADLPFLVLSDINLPDGTVLLASGKRLGHSLSTTGWKGFAGLVKQLRDQDIDPTTAFVRVKVGYESKKNASGAWGVLKFLEAREV
jgi:hypothetical protein